MKYSFIASFYNNYARRASLIRSFNFDSIDVLKKIDTSIVVPLIPKRWNDLFLRDNTLMNNYIRILSSLCSLLNVALNVN